MGRDSHFLASPSHFGGCSFADGQTQHRRGLHNNYAVTGSGARLFILQAQPSADANGRKASRFMLHKKKKGQRVYLKGGLHPEIKLLHSTDYLPMVEPVAAWFFFSGGAWVANNTPTDPPPSHGWQRSTPYPPVHLVGRVTGV